MLNNLFFWPLMNKEIQNLVSICTTCLIYQNQNEKETIINRNLPHIDPGKQ